jgi:hypothetical protein
MTGSFSVSSVSRRVCKISSPETRGRFKSKKIAQGGWLILTHASVKANREVFPIPDEQNVVVDFGFSQLPQK